MKKKVLKIAAIVLSISMFFSTSVFADSENSITELMLTEVDRIPAEAITIPDFVNRASLYIDCTSLAVHSTGGGGLDIFFSITGVHTLDQLGATWIDLYRGSDTSGGTRVASFLYTNSGYSNMMTTNSVYHSGIIHYEGATTGSFYFAVAMFYGEYNGAGDHYRHVSTVSQA